MRGKQKFNRTDQIDVLFGVRMLELVLQLIQAPLPHY